MVSTVPNAGRGAANSLRVRSAKSRVWLEDLYAHIRDLARKGELAETNDGIAAQLRARGLGAPRSVNKRTGKPVVLDGKKVHAALLKMGVDRPAIRRWRNRADKAADDFGVPLNTMLMQLWHEWLWHEKVSSLEHGLSLKEREQRMFVPTFVHPNSWVPPWVREPDSIVNVVPAAPPSARLVQALIGFLDPDKSGGHEV